MRHVKRLLLVLFLSGILSVFTGCGDIDSKADNTDKADNGVIRLAVQPGVAVTEVSQYTGILDDYLAEKGIELEYVEFMSGPAMIEAMTSGDVDIAILGNLPLFTGVSNGLDLKAIYLTLLTEKGLNGIIAAPGSGIESVADLKGKNVGVPVGTAAHLALELILNTADLTLDDVNLINIASADIGTSLANNYIDAAALWETHLTKAILRSGGTLIATSKSVMEDQTFAVAAESFLNDNPEAAQYFVAGLIQVEDYMIAYPEESIEGIQKSTGDDAGAWEYVYGLSRASGFTEDTYETAELAKQFLIEIGSIQNDYDYYEIFDQSYWDRALEILEEE